MKRVAIIMLLASVLGACGKSSKTTTTTNTTTGSQGGGSSSSNPQGPSQVEVEGVTVTFDGGTGESFDSAIVVHAPGEQSGVAAEYAYVSTIYGVKNTDWTLVDQNFFDQSGHKYDLLQVDVVVDGSESNFYFDITEFYGLEG